MIKDSGDSRDYTEKCRNYLSVFWVLRMKKRIADYVATGERAWYDLKIGEKDGDKTGNSPTNPGYSGEQDGFASGDEGLLLL